MFRFSDTRPLADKLDNPTQTYAKVPRLVQTVLGFAAMSLGAGTLVETWMHLQQQQQQLLVRTPGLVGLLLIGLGLSMVGPPRWNRRVSLLAGIPTLALACLTLFQYFLGNMVLPDWLMLRPSFGPEPALKLDCTVFHNALAFLGVSGGVLFSARRETGRGTLALVLFFLAASGLAVLTAMLACTNPMSGINPAHDGQEISYFAVAGMACLDLGLVVAVWCIADRRSKVEIPWFGSVVSLGLAVVTVFLWYVLHQQANAQMAGVVLRRMSHFQTQIGRELKTRVEVLAGTAEQWRTWQTNDGQAAWQASTGLLIRNFPGFVSVQWLDPRLRQRLSVPPQAQGKLPNQELSPGSIVSVPYEIKPGVQGFRVRVPIQVKGSIAGYLAGTFSLKELFDSIFLVDSQGDFCVSILDRGKELYGLCRKDSPAGRGWGQKVELAHGLPWTLLLWPSEDYLQDLRSVLPEAVMGLGLGLAFLMSMVLHQGQREKRMLLELKDTNAELKDQIEVRGRIEKTLRESESTLFKFLEAIPMGIFVTDPQGRPHYANQGAVKLLGHDILDPRTRLEDMPRAYGGYKAGTHELYPFDQAPLYRASRGDSTFVKDMEIRRGEKVVPVEIAGTPIRAADGQILYCLAVYNDVSWRVEAERALRFNDPRTRSIIENMLGGLVTMSPKGVIESINPAGQKMFGTRAEEVVGQPVGVLLPEFDTSSLGDGVVEAFNLKAMGHTTQGTARRKNGENFPYELSLFEFYSEGKPFFAAHINDLSARREFERLKNQFVSRVSHELRTPLTSIHGSLNLLASGVFGPLPPEATQMIQVAERNSVRLISLINDILDLERLESGKPVFRAPCPLSRVVDRSLDSVRAFAEEEGVKLQIGSMEGVLWADENRMVQVLVNLVSNAIKYSPTGGTVTVSSRQGLDWVEVRVKDEGPGIDKSLFEVIFQPFGAATSPDLRRRAGTGLGLSICKNIVEQHGGSIGVESEPGKGSSFWFRVPNATSLAAAA